jgi:outer membrane usher protein FimD/PapC
MNFYDKYYQNFPNIYYIIHYYLLLGDIMTSTNKLALAALTGLMAAGALVATPAFAGEGKAACNGKSGCKGTAAAEKSECKGHAEEKSEATVSMPAPVLIRLQINGMPLDHSVMALRTPKQTWLLPVEALRSARIHLDQAPKIHFNDTDFQLIPAEQIKKMSFDEASQTLDMQIDTSAFQQTRLQPERAVIPRLPRSISETADGSSSINFASRRSDISRSANRSRNHLVSILDLACIVHLVAVSVWC